MSAKERTEPKPAPRATARRATDSRRITAKLLMLLAVVGAVGGGGYAAWRAIAPDVLEHDLYRLRIDQVTITPTPEWIRADVRAEALRDAGLDQDTWIHEAELAERVARVFAIHPWVAEVTRVTKRPTARIDVDLVYRRPVCMVEVPGGVFPVDVEGVLLPRDDFSPAEARRYPRLAGVTSLPAGLVGMPWGDLHVVGGAEIAAALADDWESLRLDYIAVDNPASPDITFTLVAVAQAGWVAYRAAWGHAPSNLAPGEPSVEEKLARLREFVKELQTTGAASQTQEIDLRYLPAHRTATRPEP